MAKILLEHYDLLGTPLKVNDLVVYNYYNRQLTVGRILNLTPKMIMVGRVGSRMTRRICPAETVKIDGEAVTMYVLKNES